jgi:hypothetical protein
MEQQYQIGRNPCTALQNLSFVFVVSVFILFEDLLGVVFG